MPETEELIEKTIDLFFERKVINASLLQRKFRIGYPLAASVIFVLQERGLIANEYDKTIGGYRVTWSNTTTDAADFCPRCGGRKVVRNEGMVWVDCPVCEGTGKSR